jgi:TonB family protein
MPRNAYNVNWKRNFFYYSQFNSRFKIPLIISLISHLALVLFSLNKADLEVINDFSVTIESNLPRDAVLKKIDKFKTVKEETSGNKKSDIKSGNLLNATSFFKREKSKNQESGKNISNSFNEEYEKMLFSKNKAAMETTTRHTKNTDENLDWKENNNAKFSPESKENREESVKIPGGEATSSSIKWIEGYARKLVFQPEIDYPVFFRKQGIQATVIIRIRVDTDGNVISADIIRSSGYSKLDILGRNGMLKAKFSRKDNVNSSYDIADVEIQYKLER